MFLIKVRFRTLSNNSASQSVAPVQRKKNERWQGWACWKEKEGHWGRCKHNQVFPHAIVLQKLWSQSCTPVLSFNVLCFKFVTGKGKWSHFLWKCWCLWSLTFLFFPLLLVTAVLHVAGYHPLLPIHIILIESLDLRLNIIMPVNLEGLYDCILYFKKTNISSICLHD